MVTGPSAKLGPRRARSSRTVSLPLDPSTSLGVEPERGRRLDSALGPEHLEGSNRHSSTGKMYREHIKTFMLLLLLTNND